MMQFMRVFIATESIDPNNSGVLREIYLCYTARNICQSKSLACEVLALLLVHSCGSMGTKSNIYSIDTNCMGVNMKV